MQDRTNHSIASVSDFNDSRKFNLEMNSSQGLHLSFHVKVVFLLNPQRLHTAFSMPAYTSKSYLDGFVL